MAEAKKEIERIEITPAKNGGHTVRHSFKSKPSYSKSHGMGMEHVPSEEVVFGSGEGKKMMAHVGKHLGIGAPVKAQTDEAGD